MRKRLSFWSQLLRTSSVQRTGNRNSSDQQRAAQALQNRAGYCWWVEQVGLKRTKQTGLKTDWSGWKRTERNRSGSATGRARAQRSGTCARWSGLHRSGATISGQAWTYWSGKLNRLGQRSRALVRVLTGRGPSARRSGSVASAGRGIAHRQTHTHVATTGSGTSGVDLRERRGTAGI